MDFIVIPDTAIFAVNRGKQENESSNIVYIDRDGKWHSIDFETCASNFKEENGSSSGKCVGERNIDEFCYIFYTSGIKTKVVFEKENVRNILRYHLLSGSKTSRFLTLQKLINETRFTTYDLT